MEKEKKEKIKNFIEEISNLTKTDVDDVMFFLEEHSFFEIGSNLGAGVYFFRETNPEINCEEDQRNWLRVKVLEFVYIHIDTDLDFDYNSPIDTGQYPCVISATDINYTEFQNYIKGVEK